MFKLPVLHYAALNLTILLSLTSHAAPPPPVATSTTVTTASETKNRADYAKELVKILQLEAKVQQFYDGSLNYFKAIPENPDAQIFAKRKKANEIALSKFENDKLKIMNDSILGLEKQFSSKFSASELKYLIDLTKYGIFKRFTTLQESPEFAKAISNPFTMAKSYLDEEKKKLGLSLEPEIPTRPKQNASDIKK